MNHPNTERIMKIFAVYFEDPSMIAEYGLKEVPAKHRGPAEQESIFGRYKHSYTEKTLTNDTLDNILFKHYKYRQMMVHRFVEDFQNGKRDKGIKEALDRYRNVQGAVQMSNVVTSQVNCFRKPCGPKITL